MILITKKIKRKSEMLCKFDLNDIYLKSDLNEYAITLLNYYIGLFDIETECFKKITLEIKQILISNGIHLQPSCKERLY